jgi:glycosyltransferase involved in cell wall biosynthesis
MDRREGVELCICAPYKNGDRFIYGKWGKKSSFYAFQKNRWQQHIYDQTCEEIFKEILNIFQPDVVHIFGTEYPHSLSMVRAFNRPERTVIHIQGLVSVYAKHYCAFLPEAVTTKSTYWDFIRHRNIAQQAKKFAVRGEFEAEAIRGVGHVMGRTDWDEACCKAINPNVEYHYVQEMMRKEFYDKKPCWQIETCERHSIFMSQGGYPIKGLHLALEGLASLVKIYPDVKLYIAGGNLINSRNKHDKIRETYYVQYIRLLIDKWKLSEHVVFTGSLDALQMRGMYLRAHVFLSPSVIENSPNSIGEAMLLGAPIVASDVGGVSSLINHRENGYLYQADAPYMMAYYISRIFESDIEAAKISKNEMRCAGELYDRSAIVEQLMETYEEMILM